MKRALTVLLIFVVANGGALAAQRPVLPPIDTDRPDVTDGTGTVARGHVQIEAGYTRVTSRLHQTAYSLPEVLVRVGLSSRAELRLSETYRSGFAEATSVATTGWDDVQLGTKVALFPGRGARPAISAEAFVAVPTGADAISAHRALPGAAVLAQWDGDGPWSAGAELQAARGADAGISWIPSLSIQFRPADPVQLYGELFSLQSTSAAIAEESYFNSGVLVLLSNNVQVDARIAFGLNHAATLRSIGFGIALRR